jgi:hypothetical protein
MIPAVHNRDGPYRTNATPPAEKLHPDLFPLIALVLFLTVTCRGWIVWADHPFGVELTLVSAALLVSPYLTLLGEAAYQTCRRCYERVL